jgi:hypothetical protein
MPYRTFNNWLFDGMKDTPIPSPKTDDKGKVIVPDILKYNSPITHTFVLQMFMRHGALNEYLNTYFNNINVRYLTREELFLFIKKCVLDFRVLRRDIVFYPYRAKNKLYDSLRERISELKNDDISLLCDIIERSDDKELIYYTLGLEKPAKREKIKIGDKKINRQEKIVLKNFIKEHFSTINV